jgi:hypothetical protein
MKPLILFFTGLTCVLIAANEPAAEGGAAEAAPQLLAPADLTSLLEKDSLFVRSRGALDTNQLGVATELITAPDGGLKAVRVEIWNNSEDRHTIITFESDATKAFSVFIHEGGSLVSRLRNVTTDQKREFTQQLLAPKARHQWIVPIEKFMTDELKGRVSEGVEAKITVWATLYAEKAQADADLVQRTFVSGGWSVGTHPAMPGKSSRILIPMVLGEDVRLTAESVKPTNSFAMSSQRVTGASGEHPLVAASREALKTNDLGLATKLVIASDGGIKGVEVEIWNDSKDRHIPLSFESDETKSFLLMIREASGTRRLSRFTGTPVDAKRHFNSMVLPPGRRHRWIVPIAPFLTEEAKVRLSEPVKARMTVTVWLWMAEVQQTTGVPPPSTKAIPVLALPTEQVLLTQESLKPLPPGLEKD